jgi:hypothetical protein
MLPYLWESGKSTETGDESRKLDCATWLHKARQLPKEQFKHEVNKHLTGKESEPWEMLYFKVYKSQLAMIEQARLRSCSAATSREGTV